MPRKRKPDVEIENHGTLFTFALLTPAAIAWANDNLPDDCPRFWGRLAVEHRYAESIANGMLSDGLLVV